MKEFNTYLIEKLRINKDTELGNSQFIDEIIDFLDSINDSYKKKIDIEGVIRTLNFFFNKHKEIKGLNVYLSEKDNNDLDLNKSFKLINNVYSEDKETLNKLDDLFFTTYFKKGFEVLKNDWGIEIKDFETFNDKIYFIDKDKENKIF